MGGPRPLSGQRGVKDEEEEEEEKEEEYLQRRNEKHFLLHNLAAERFGLR